ncbi:MAG: Cu(I)-responsive transcriptional regulator [Burkholderiaceae bacterium]|nr:Cu(I)-responsive transcriptional regulator [Burkholderiaceae bacterium]
MNIGEASRASGVSAKMIRHYESLGLVPPAARNDAGYRRYTANDVHLLAFIARARDLGFSIAEITQLVGLWQDRTRPSAKVKALALEHVERLERKVRELLEMKATIEELAASCHGDDRPQCPILDSLASGEDAPPAPDTAPGTARTTPARSPAGINPNRAGTARRGAGSRSSTRR